MNDLEALQEYEDYLVLRSSSRTSAERLDPFEYYEEKEFQQRYRISKVGVEELLLYIGEDLNPSQHRHGFNLTSAQRLLLTLRFLATGNFQRVDGDLFGVSQSSVSRIVHQVIKAIAKTSRRFIVFPTESEIQTQKLRFASVCGFPSVVGVLDCTHIPISSPGGDNAEIFRNRKVFFFIKRTSSS